MSSKKPTSTKPLNFSSSKERDDYFRDHADYYTVFRQHGVGIRERIECKTLGDAEKLAHTKATIGGGKWMIYAVIGMESAYVKTLG
jgi:hypothetical protein